MIATGMMYATSFTRDSVGHVTALAYPNGVVANYTYKDGKVAGISAKANGATVPVATTLLYQPFGPASNWTNGNGLVTTRTFDTDARLIGIGVVALPTIVQSLTFGYDEEIQLPASPTAQ